MSIHAGMIFVIELIMVRAFVNMATECWCAALYDIVDGTLMTGQYLIVMLSDISWAVRSQDVGHGNHVNGV
jgi:hypothetical protein